MKDIVNILQRFKKEITTFFPPCDISEIEKLEKNFNLKLPKDYSDFLLLTNGFILMSNEIYGIGNKEEDLKEVYLRETEEVAIPIMKHLVPFSPDGQGNFYCFDVKTGKVVFWVSNYNYTEEDQPEAVNDSFVEWIKEVIIEWTIDDNEEEDLFDKNRERGGGFSLLDD